MSMNFKMFCVSVFALNYIHHDIYVSAIKNEEDDPSDIFDILLWAIFANRKEIAEIYWLHGTDHIRRCFF